MSRRSQRWRSSFLKSLFSPLIRGRPRLPVRTPLCEYHKGHHHADGWWHGIPADRLHWQTLPLRTMHLQRYNVLCQATCPCICGVRQDTSPQGFRLSQHHTVPTVNVDNASNRLEFAYWSIKENPLKWLYFNGFWEITESIVVPPGIEPGTQGFSVLCSTNWAMAPCVVRSGNISFAVAKVVKLLDSASLLEIKNTDKKLIYLLSVLYILKIF